jgi:hypothetical protein
MTSRSRRFARPAALALLALGASGCEAYGVQIKPLATSVERPSNVAVYLQASASGAPLDRLALGNFQIYEDGQRLDPSQISLTLLPDAVATAHRALLLLDLTAARSAADRQTLSQAAAGFVRSVERTQPVSVFAFDGGANIYPVGDFAENPKGDAPQKLDKLDKLASSDPSRNLYGAMLQALARLDATLASNPKPVRVGTLVVFTGGPDLAKRAGWSALQAALDHTRDSVIAVGMDERTGLPLGELGPDGAIPMTSLVASGQALGLAAARVAALDQSRYLLAYCSPARDGVRNVRVEIDIADANGMKKSGDTSLRFSADGFAPGCNSSEPPRFVVTLVAAPGGTVPGLAPPGEVANEENKPAEHRPKHRYVPRSAHVAPHPAKPTQAPDFEP